MRNTMPRFDEFVAAVLDDHPKNRFLAEFRRFHEQVVNWGLYSALSQTLLKLTVARRARHLSGPGALGFQPR